MIASLRSSLAGTGQLVRLILRRDRITLLLWVGLVALAPVAIAASFPALYPTDAAIQAYANESMNTPSAVGMLGVIFSPTLGGLVAWRTGLQSVILIAPVAMLYIVRHTRTEEAAGRRELLGATVVGRFAPLTAALIVVLAANLVIAGLIAAGLAGLGLPASGSIALGLSAASAGWVFAAIAAVAAQVAESP
jgi:ABC-2 type transport system permease protein